MLSYTPGWSTNETVDNPDAFFPALELKTLGEAYPMTQGLGLDTIRHLTQLAALECNRLLTAFQNRLVSNSLDFPVSKGLLYQEAVFSRLMVLALPLLAVDPSKSEARHYEEGALRKEALFKKRSLKMLAEIDPKVSQVLAEAL